MDREKIEKLARANGIWPDFLGPSSTDYQAGILRFAAALLAADVAPVAKGDLLAKIQASLDILASPQTMLGGDYNTVSNALHNCRDMVLGRGYYGGAIPTTAPASESVDTPEFKKLMRHYYDTASSFAGSVPADATYEAVIAHINAHTAAQVAASLRETLIELASTQRKLIDSQAETAALALQVAASKPVEVETNCPKCGGDAGSHSIGCHSDWTEPTESDMFCAQRGGDGMVCATGCVCGKVPAAASGDEVMLAVINDNRRLYSLLETQRKDFQSAAIKAQKNQWAAEDLYRKLRLQYDEVCAFAEKLKLTTTPPAQAPALPATGDALLLDALTKNVKWELAMDWAAEDQEWCVWNVTGSPNDREWHEIGRGNSPRAAIIAALKGA